MKQKISHVQSAELQTEGADPTGMVVDPTLVTANATVERRVVASCAERVSSAGMATRVVLLEGAAAEVGVRRAAFLESLSLLADDEAAITITYGKVTVSVNKNGAALLNTSGDRLAVTAGGVNPRARASLPGSAPGNKKIGKILVPCGVCAIVAGGGRGKTPLAHTMAAQGVDHYSVVRVGEPLAGYASSNSAESIAYSIAVAMLDSADIVLDSVKDLLSSGGSLMKSGLSRDALTALSSWGTAACDAGCTIYIPVNPSTPDAEVNELLIEAGKSNATMLVTPSQNVENWDYFNRKGEGLPRSSGKFKMKFAQNGLAVVSDGTHNSEKVVTDTEVTQTVMAALSRTAFSSAARRALSIAQSGE